MVSDLLLLIRAQEPITPSSANRLNVMEQLRATAARLEPQAAEAGVQLNIKGDDDLVINGEADQIDSAVTKLIENAIGYSKENGVVSVSASKDKDGDRAVIRVIDQGTGIAKKDQARIFERFYRGVEQSNRTADGVGPRLGHRQACGADPSWRCDRMERARARQYVQPYVAVGAVR